MTIGTGQQPAVQKSCTEKQTQHMFPTSSSLFLHFKENRCKYDGFHIGLCFCIAAGNCVFIVHIPHQSPLSFHNNNFGLYHCAAMTQSRSLAELLQQLNFFIDNQKNLGVVAGADLSLAVYWAIFKLFVQLHRYSGYFTDKYKSSLRPKEFTLKIQGGHRSRRESRRWLEGDWE